MTMTVTEVWSLRPGHRDAARAPGAAGGPPSGTRAGVTVTVTVSVPVQVTDGDPTLRLDYDWVTVTPRSLLSEFRA